MIKYSVADIARKNIFFKYLNNLIHNFVDCELNKENPVEHKNCAKEFATNLEKFTILTDDTDDVYLKDFFEEFVEDAYKSKVSDTAHHFLLLLADRLDKSLEVKSELKNKLIGIIHKNSNQYVRILGRRNLRKN